MVYLFCTTLISVDFAHCEIFCVEVGFSGKGEIRFCSLLSLIQMFAYHFYFFVGFHCIVCIAY